jgi:hypothetical protein
MHNPKLEAARRQTTVERLFGKDGKTSQAEGAEEEKQDGKQDENPLERKSYCILRGRIEPLPSLEVINRQGETRLFPWSYFGGANLNHPGEMVLIFDGPEGSSRITVSGRCLDRELLGGVKSQRVSWIRELEELAAAGAAHADPIEPVATGIWIAGGGREWSRGAGRPR